MTAALEHAEPVPEISWQASEAVASWRRLLSQTSGDKRANFERASVELLRLANAEAGSKQVIVDELAEMAEAAGIAANEAQDIFARACKAPPDRGPKVERPKRSNGRAHETCVPIEEPPAASSADNYRIKAVPAEGKASGRFVPVPIDKIELPAGPAHLIDGILPIRGLALFVGEPKAGKSNLAADMGFFIARGAAYGGRKTLQGPVFYLTREGVTGAKRRFVAMRRHHNVEGQGAPFYLIDNMPTIGGERTDVDDLLRELDAYIAEHKLPKPRLIILDTLARCIGEGDENSARDMGRVVTRCEAIERPYECLVALVHHVGKDPNRGARGSNSLNAAADVLILIEKNERHRSARVEQMKDGSEGTEWKFRLVPFDLGETSDTPTETGENVSACVVDLLSEPTEAKQRETKTRRPPRGVPGHLLKVIRRALEEAGERNVASDLVPPNTPAIDRATTRRYCKIMAWQDQDEKPDAFRATLSRSLSTLRDAGAIGFTQDWIWLT